MGETIAARLLLDGLTFPESPRWHEGLLWFVDMFARRVMTVDLAGSSTVIAELDDLPAGLGFLPDGCPIVVLRRERRIVRLDNGRVHADLNALRGYGSSATLNDMVVDAHGRAYVDLVQAPDARNDAIVFVDAHGDCRVVAEGLCEPNGLALTPDMDTLVVGMGLRGPSRSLMAYDIGVERGLTRPRLYADTRGEGVDGVCMDAHGAVWFATFFTGRFVRVRRRAEVAAEISIAPRCSTACVLGGDERRILLMTTTLLPPNPRLGPTGNMDQAQGFIELAEVSVPGAGFP